MDTFELSYRDAASVFHKTDPFSRTLFIVAVRTTGASSAPWDLAG